jgi:hypothetical protein
VRVDHIHSVSGALTYGRQRTCNHVCGSRACAMSCARRSLRANTLKKLSRMLTFRSTLYRKTVKGHFRAIAANGPQFMQKQTVGHRFVTRQELGART